MSVTPDPDLTPGPALDCISCGALSPIKADDDEDCPACGEFAGPMVQIEACPDPETCEDDDHDFGRGVHVIEN